MSLVLLAIFSYGYKPIICCRQLIPIERAVPSRLTAPERSDYLPVAIKNIRQQAGFVMAITYPPRFVLPVPIWRKKTLVHKQEYFFLRQTATILVAYINGI